MNSLERTLETIGHGEPDRVPLFLLLTFYGARELGMSIKDYFSDPGNVVEGQLLMRKKYKNDCLYNFHYASLEHEAFGGETLWFDDGPPNAGAPVIESPQSVTGLGVPDVARSPGLAGVLEATRELSRLSGGEAPVVGVVMSPFSLPVMQMGFENYLKLVYFHPEQFRRLMEINTEFCVSWANAQLDAGAAAITYFNPMASPSMVEKSTYLSTGYPVDRRVIQKIKGPTATHLASGLVGPVLDELADTGTLIAGFGVEDDPAELKKAARGKICLLGNLNGIDMAGWDVKKAEENVKELIAAAGPGGGFILSDSHGEIPWQVPGEVLLSISEAVEKYGRYPMKWSG